MTDNHLVDMGRIPVVSLLFHTAKRKLKLPVVYYGKLALRITAITDPFDGQSIGNAMYGLQGMNSDETEVRAVLSALNTKIIASIDTLSGQ